MVVVRYCMNIFFSREENKSLFVAHEELGNKWTQIMNKYFKGSRNDKQLKNRFSRTHFKTFIAREASDGKYKQHHFIVFLYNVHDL